MFSTKLACTAYVFLITVLSHHRPFPQSWRGFRPNIAWDLIVCPEGWAERGIMKLQQSTKSFARISGYIVDKYWPRRTDGSICHLMKQENIAICLPVLQRFDSAFFQTLPNLDVHQGVAVYHTLKIFSIVNAKDLLMPHTKFQVCT